MNIMPAVGFYWKHGSQLQAMFVQSNTPNGARLILDLADALLPVIEKHFPQYNQDDMLDDAVAMLREIMAPPPLNIDPTNQS